MRAYDADELVTDGVYRYCRHPLYASWVVFIGPGIALLLESWLALTTAIFMYLLLRILVKKEEAYLETIFGSRHREYKKKVRCIMPYGVIKPGV
jgi:protein-S-isoprenylcysteine O-methyltransferase Ste14